MTHKQGVVKGTLPGNFFSGWLIITDNLNVIEKSDENLEVVYSTDSMCSNTKANSPEPKNGLWKIMQVM